MELMHELTLSLYDQPPVRCLGDCHGPLRELAVLGMSEWDVWLILVIGLLTLFCLSGVIYLLYVSFCKRKESGKIDSRGESELGVVMSSSIAGMGRSTGGPGSTSS